MPARKRLRPGELDGLVLAYMAKRRDDGPLTTPMIGKGLGRSPGAVANCLGRLAKGQEGAPGQEATARLRPHRGEAAMRVRVATAACRGPRRRPQGGAGCLCRASRHLPRPSTSRSFASPLHDQGPGVTRRAPTSPPPPPEMKTRFGQNLARCREGAEVSQEELSFRASIHRTEVSLLERGERMPRVDTALRIAGSLGVPLEDLVAGLE